jgi:hypothetical protein
MKFFLLFISLILIQFVAVGQATTASKILLKNKDIITGKILEVKPGEFVKIEILGNNVITIPYNDIETIYLDATQATPTKDNTNNMASPKDEKPLNDFYFESHNELLVSVGAGKIYGLPAEIGGFPTGIGRPRNSNIFGGIYTSNGVGYKKQYYAGIGFGYNGHSTNNNFSIPYVLDLRYRAFPDKKFSPMALFAFGAEYQRGGMGAITFIDGLGLSIKFKEHFNAHFIFSHTYIRYNKGLSIENGPVEESLGSSYSNYVGARIGVSFKL